MSTEEDGGDWPWPCGPVEEHYSDYEAYVVGVTDVEPSLDHLTPEEREQALSDRQYLDWKYADGLVAAGDRHAGDPEFYRSTFRIIQGGLSQKDKEVT